MLMCAGVIWAQDYPSKPIRIITGAAGGGSDFTSRQIAQAMSPAIGQPVVVDNRATTILAADGGAKAPADGYYMFMVGSSAWIFQILQKAPYDANDFVPISLVERSANIVAVHPSVPAKSIRELIALAKARPGELNYASISIGGPQHLAGELFKSMAGVNITHIPYKANAPAITALISGEVQLYISDVGLLLPHVKTGKMRALAVSSLEKSALVPDLPTVASAGLPGYEMIGVTGVFAPPKTPATFVSRLNREIVRVLALPDVKERFLTAGVEIIGSTPEQLATKVKADLVGIAKLVKDAGIKIQ